MEVLLLFAFISGLVTILAPCIWPILPIILSSSITGGKAKSLGITLGVMISFTVFTLSISYLVNLFGLDPNLIRTFAVIVLVFLGLSMIIPKLAQVLEGFVSRLSGRMGQGKLRTGFWGGFITGCSLGIVWTPCTGPILAAIATLAATTQLNSGIILVTVVYVIGVGIPLFFFSYGGQKLITKTRFISAFTGRIQQVFGFVLLLTALSIYTGYDKIIQVQLLNLFPSYTQALINLESNDDVKKQLNILKGKSSDDSMVGTAFSPLQPGQSADPVFNANTPAPEFVGITKWLNTDKPVVLKEQQGKVVLVDIWTYTCINCIRTIPRINKLYDKYKDKGLVVVGVHSPEFEFEKDTKNVEDAIKRFGIKYPVAQDNDFKTWDAYDNQYWPAKYLIDAKGNIRYTHYGEGKYEETEKAIQLLLKEAGQQVNDRIVNDSDNIEYSKNSPETYLGSGRMLYLVPGGKAKPGKQDFTLQKNIPANKFSFGGNWTVADQFSRSGENAVLEYNFTANKVFLVMRPGTAGKNATVKVYLDGKLVSVQNAGTDVKNGVVKIDADRVYNLIDNQGKTEKHNLRLEFQTPGIEAFAFTFG